MNIRCATLDDFEKIVSFYKYSIKNTMDMEIYARWIYGQHPTDKMIKDYIEQDAMYILDNKETIVAAMAVTLYQGIDYHSIEWGLELKDHDVAVVHILCVNPDYQRQGIGKKMIEESIRIAEKESKKAIRLDALASNIPAHQMYEAKGFQFSGKRKMYAENTGWTDFIFFEMQRL